MLILKTKLISLTNTGISSPATAPPLPVLGFNPAAPGSHGCMVYWETAIDLIKITSTGSQDSAWPQEILRGST